MISIHIRSEKISDYSSIAEIHTLAFDKQPSGGEAALVDILRHRIGFDPGLSLVAEMDGQLMGHVLFTPLEMRVGGIALRAVLLAPLSVIPRYQNQGVGGKLIEEGHRRAIDKGYSFSFLIGHPTYYPKFGYCTHMFGTCQISLDIGDIAASADILEERKVTIDDIPQLISMWEYWFSTTDLAIFPGHKLIDWVSVNKRIRSSTLLINGEMAGYVRYAAQQPDQILYFVAKDERCTQAILYHMSIKAAQTQGSSKVKLTLPVHPGSSATQRMISCQYQSEVHPWDAAMVRILKPDCRTIVQYCEELSAGIGKQGGFVWPVEFDVLN